jgi:hypothetical protein
MHGLLAVTSYAWFAFCSFKCLVCLPLLHMHGLLAVTHVHSLFAVTDMQGMLAATIYGGSMLHGHFCQTTMALPTGVEPGEPHKL